MDAINGALARLYTVVKTAKDEDGQTFVEYSLIGLLIAVALVVTLGLLSTEIGNALTDIKNALIPPKAGS